MGILPVDDSGFEGDIWSMMVVSSMESTSQHDVGDGGGDGSARGI